MMKRVRTLQKRIYRNRFAWRGVFLVVTILCALYPVAPSLGQTYQGFGAGTLGGAGQPIYLVTNLNDSGPGSLRDALSQGNRHIIFDVAGEILLQSKLIVQGANITLDGLAAASPGITIKNYGLFISGDFGAHDVIVRGIRIHIVNDQPGQEDGISIVSGVYNVVIDHVSIRGASDESIGISNSYNVTVSWSMLADPINAHNSNMLISNGARRVSIHHNLFIQAGRRNPWVAWEESPGQIQPEEAPEIQADVRNNLMWDVSGPETNHGTVVFGGAKANIVNNYYKSLGGINRSGQKRVIVICKESGFAEEDRSFCKGRLDLPPGRAYVAGNFSADGWTAQINAKGSEIEAFPAAAVDTTDACSAAERVLAEAGMKPPDVDDEQYLATILLQSCGGTEPTPPPVGTPTMTSPVPSSVLPGPDVTFNWTAGAANVRNWQLFIGSTQGAKDLHDTGKVNASKTSKFVKGLPTDGRAIWVRLRFDIGGTWQFADFQYIAALR